MQSTLNLNALTVAQLKAMITQLNFKVPSALKKADLIFFYEQALKMRYQGIPETVPKKSLQLRYTPVRPNPNFDLLTHLQTYGWAVAKVPNFDPTAARKGILDWLHRVCPAFDPDRPETWVRKNIPYNLHGIFKNWVGHLESIWATREACIPIFASLWGSDDLLTSFDGCCLLSRNNSGGYKQWMHCDQGRRATYLANVQGAVNLFPNGPEDGGTLLISGSHNKFTDYIERHPVDGITAFFPIDPEDSVLADCPVVKPCLEEGEILLWDSRTFHCNIAPQSQNPRICIYVSMQPKSQATQAELQKRIELYQEGRMTGHWCYGPFFSVCGKEPNPMYTQGIPRPGAPEIAPLNPVRRKLIGY